jgi:hypothetical protein
MIVEFNAHFYAFIDDVNAVLVLDAGHTAPI